MSTILEKPISVNRTLATSHEHARAIEDPARAKILQFLYRKHLNAEQITKQLKKSGYKKALTTTRHHIEILKDAQKNRFVLLGIMSAAGWDFYKKEWWHYQLFNSKKYKLINNRMLKKPIM